MEKIVNLVEHEFAPSAMHLRKKNIWVDYDKEADTLYVSFQKPQRADDSEMIGNKIIHYRRGKVIGVTIINASKIGRDCS